MRLSGIDVTAIRIGTWRSMLFGNILTASAAIALSIPDRVRTPVNTPAAKIVVTISMAALECARMRSRCSAASG